MEEVQKYRNLYDTSLRKYQDVVAADKSWIKIADRLENMFVKNDRNNYKSCF